MQKTQKTLALLMAIVLVIALFAACSGSGDTGVTTDAPAATSTQAAAPTATPAPTEGTETEPPEETNILQPAPAELPRAGDNLAVDSSGNRKYEVDGKYPTSYYEYELPLTTSMGDDTFSIFTFLFDDTYLNGERLADMPFQSMLRDTTGVNIDYLVLPYLDLPTQSAIALAGDDLPDIIQNPAWYLAGNTPAQLIDDKFIVNLWDYAAYLPNYLYQIPHNDFDPDLVNTIFYNEETVATITGLYENNAAEMAYMFRGDMLNDVGIDVKTINTYDKVHSALVALKVGGVENPMGLMGGSVEQLNGVFFGGMNTGALISAAALPALRRENNQIFVTTTEEVDRQGLELLVQWNNEGLLHQSFLLPTAGANDAIGKAELNGEVAFVPMTPSVVDDVATNTDDPDAVWDAGPHFGLTEDFKFQYAKGVKRWEADFCVWAINAKSNNLPLLISYADWAYSEDGKFAMTWGPENVTHEFNDKGEVGLTQFIYDDIVSTKLLVYAASQFTDVGVIDKLRFCASPKGSRLLDIYKRLTLTDYPFKTSMDVPGSVSSFLSQEDKEEINTLTADASIFIAESYFAFLDGSKQLTEWNDYITQLNEIGLSRVKAMYQTAYDNFLVEYPDYRQ